MYVIWYYRTCTCMFNIAIIGTVNFVQVLDRCNTSITNIFNVYKYDILNKIYLTYNELDFNESLLITHVLPVLLIHMFLLV